MHTQLTEHEEVTQKDIEKLRKLETLTPVCGAEKALAYIGEGLTVDQAQDRYIIELKAEMAILNRKKEELEKRLAERR
jgi:hypothetical protein